MFVDALLGRPFRWPGPAARSNAATGGFKVVLQLRGNAQLSQDEPQAWLQPGDLAIYDTSRQYTISTDGDRFQCFVLMFPVTLLGIPIDAMRRVTCTRIDGRDGLGGLISPFLSRMAGSALAHQPYVDSRLMRNTMDLIETLYRQRLDLAPADPDSVMRSRLLVVKAYQALAGQYDQKQILELLALTGTYTLLSFILNTARVQIDPWLTDPAALPNPRSVNEPSAEPFRSVHR